VLIKMDTLTLLGLIAGGLTTASFLPQVIQTWTTRSVRDLSYWMIVMFWIGIGLWLLYGLGIGSLPIIAANAVTILLVSLLLVMKLRFRDR
jgi:MtN3 and saliva related transmembrane protein